MGLDRGEESHSKPTLFIAVLLLHRSIQAETLNFPLQNGGVQFQTTQEFVSKMKVNLRR